MAKENNPRMQRAIALAGGASVLARRMGLTRQAVVFWVQGVREVSMEQAIAISKALEGQMTPDEILPDADWAYLRAVAMRAAWEPVQDEYHAA